MPRDNGRAAGKGRPGLCRFLLISVRIALLAVFFAVVRASAGELTLHSVPSVALGKDLSAMVYQPDGPAPEGGWPVVYLLHGLGGSEQSWPQLGMIGPTLDAMIGAGQIAPMLVVMPDAANSWYVRAKGAAPGTGIEAALLADLPTWVEATFPARKDRGGRAIVGVSMGGYGALRLALMAPDRYVAAAGLSAAIWQNIPDSDLDMPPDQLAFLAATAYFHDAGPMTVVAGPDLPNPGKHFEGAFGNPFDPRFFNETNVFTLLDQDLRQGVTLPAIYLTVGDDDSHLLWRGAISLYETMLARKHSVELRITNGDHVWSLWRVSIKDALTFVDGQMHTP